MAGQKYQKSEKKLIGRLKMLRRTNRKSCSEEKKNYIMQKIIETTKTD